MVRRLLDELWKDTNDFARWKDQNNYIIKELSNLPRARPRTCKRKSKQTCPQEKASGKMTVKVPPLKCQGIKTKLANWIKDHSTYENNGTWIEPFMGSGVVGFNIAPRRAIFADINPHIINFYNAIKNRKITAGSAKEFLEHEGALLQKHGEDHYY